ncbi:SDR family NAD(P)-dependent oxidoreductase [Streptomyces sp. NBC_00691]|uniref:SDR family NAD(P)-dependent oxidoreductase n=1 Tax=Streptomyces sp. NBC_00691 TaxID=2903671 RepID=UPI002E32CE2C|nr:SDR family NAD(P)-dependent oxidoreductase [Streptomyces sp. NBC_00691]
MAGKKVLVVGATGMVGGLATQTLVGRGCAVAVAGRDAHGLAERSNRWGNCPHRSFDAYDLEGAAGLASWASQALGGLDTVVVAVGVAGFGRAEEVTEAAAEHLMTVNALAPMAVVRGALPVLEPPGAVVVVTGMIVDRPMRSTADYTAAKTALAAWLGVVEREQRDRGIAVVDVRLPHLDGGFADRAFIGRAPRLPRGADAAQAVARYVIAPITDAAARTG